MKKETFYKAAELENRARQIDSCIKQLEKQGCHEPISFDWIYDIKLKQEIKDRLNEWLKKEYRRTEKEFADLK